MDRNGQAYMPMHNYVTLKVDSHLTVKVNNFVTVNNYPSPPQPTPNPHQHGGHPFYSDCCRGEQQQRQYYHGGQAFSNHYEGHQPRKRKFCGGEPMVGKYRWEGGKETGIWCQPPNINVKRRKMQEQAPPPIATPPNYSVDRYCNSPAAVPSPPASYNRNPTPEVSLPLDPNRWTHDHVISWLSGLARRHRFHVDAEKFLMNGKGLCFMTLDGFRSRSPRGGALLHADLQRKLKTRIYYLISNAS